jgi:hypothetical protein
MFCQTLPSSANAQPLGVERSNVGKTRDQAKVIPASIAQGFAADVKELTAYDHQRFALLVGRIHERGYRRPGLVRVDGDEVGKNVVFRQVTIGLKKQICWRVAKGGGATRCYADERPLS